MTTKAKTTKKTKTEAGAAPKVYSITIYDAKGKKVEEVALDKVLFDGNVNRRLLYQAVRMYLANKRQGNASTKTRGDVSGGGKKLWRQKGTGRARMGSTRSPLWRHGGIVFGPHTRDFSYAMPKKMKKAAFLASLNAKIVSSQLKGIDTLDAIEPKTKNFKAVVDALKLQGKSLFIVDAISENLSRASRNLAAVTVKNTSDVNMMDVLRCDTLVVSKAALAKLPERLKG